MAGGVGSRFFPFSTVEKPKQFLDFFGTGYSLLQMTFNRIKPLVPVENIYIVSNILYKDIILEQLPALKERQILLEPMRRNTAPCIAYASYKIASETDNANVIVLPSDHLITDEAEFQRVAAESFKFVEKHNTVLLTLGMKPTRPETGYGYIQITDGTGELRKVKTFTEKPNLEMAKTFLASGEFYWNSGMFFWSLNAITGAFKDFLPEIAAKFAQGTKFYNTPQEQAFIDEIFPFCQNISIDYGIMEKAKNVYVMMANFGWSDLGTWCSLYELGEKDENRNAAYKCKTQLYDCADNLVVMPENQLAVIDGLSGYLIAHHNNVLLICKKEEEHKIRAFVADIGETPYGKKFV
jgi:mannose-1-phosphate guanylyltransferase